MQLVDEKVKVFYFIGTINAVNLTADDSIDFSRLIRPSLTYSWTYDRCKVWKMLWYLFGSARFYRLITRNRS